MTTLPPAIPIRAIPWATVLAIARTLEPAALPAGASNALRRARTGYAS